MSSKARYRARSMQDGRQKNFEKICHYADSPLDSISPSLYIQRPWNARASIGLMESLDRERYLRWQRKPLQRRLRPHQLRRLLRRLLRRNSLRTIACAASDSVAHHSPPLFFSLCLLYETATFPQVQAKWLFIFCPFIFLSDHLTKNLSDKK